MHQTPGFYSLTGETLIKEPGSINGGEFYLDTLIDCTVYLLDNTALVYVDDCKNCTFHIGPVSGSCFLRTSENCTVYVVCR